MKRIRKSDESVLADARRPAKDLPSLPTPDISRMGYNPANFAYCIGEEPWVSGYSVSYAISTVSGTFNTSNATFNITASNPDHISTGNCLVATTVSLSGSITNVGCDTGSGTWSNSLGNNGNWTWTKTCDVPNGYLGSATETSYKQGWDPNLPTLFDFYAQVNADRDFKGRTVQETDPGGGTDGCSFPGSTKPLFTRVSGTAWEVGADTYNVYADGNGAGESWDLVGYYSDVVDYYQAQRPARGLSMPCSATVPQAMVIYCNSGSNQHYKNNTLVSTIGTNYIAESRDGVSSGNKTYP